MRATLINRTNQAMFLPALPEEVMREASLLIGAVDESETACGVMAVGGDEYEPAIRYLYVEPGYRRLGAASEMLKLFHAYAMSEGIDLLQAAYLNISETEDLQKFLEAAGFRTEEKAERLFTCKLSQLKGMLGKKDKNGEVSGCLYLEEVAKSSFLALKKALRESEEEKKQEHRFLLSEQNSYDGAFSTIHLNEAYVPDACVLTSGGGRSFRVELVWNGGKNPAVPLVLLKKSFKRAYAALLPDTEVTFVGTTAEGEKLIKRLSGEKAKPVTSTIRQYYVY